MEKCNRAQVVTFLYRAAGSPSVSGTNPFVDVPAGSFFEAPVLWAVANKITNGMDATHFGPTSTCNRAQIVTFLYRVYAGELRISSQPQNATGSVGQAVSFTVTAVGGKAPYSYRWQVRYTTSGSSTTNWMNIDADAWAEGVDTATLSFQVDRNEFTNRYQYRCIITDAVGSTVTSDTVWVIE